MEKIKIAIAGAAGYTAGELIRLLIHHPRVEIRVAQSESQAGKPLSDVHTDLIGDTKQKFSAELSDDFDVLFLCKGHGESKKYLLENPSLFDKSIIDLSQDFRLKGDHDFIYALPEMNRDQIKKAKHLANPGCFATAMQLALLPAVKNKMVVGDIHISGITGSTGAGQSFSPTSHFSWRSNNASVYKVLEHQHLLEVGESVNHVGGIDGAIHFVPYRGAFTRGIVCTTYFNCGASVETIKEAYQHAYSDEPFTHVVESAPDVKQVVNTNKCLIWVNKIGDQAVVVSAIDNLLKGASGQAVQNLNMMNGWEEKTGLQLKSNAF